MVLLHAQITDQVCEFERADVEEVFDASDDASGHGLECSLGVVVAENPVRVAWGKIGRGSAQCESSYEIREAVGDDETV